MVASAPAVIADGHHRYETALAYREERRAGGDGTGGDAELLMTLMVELNEEQLHVRPIHRLLAGLGDGVDLVAALTEFFEVRPAGPDIDDLPARMAAEGALGLVVPDGVWLLQPRAPDADQPDSALFEAALAALPTSALDFHHSPDAVAKAVATGEAQAGVLLRPVAMRHIGAAAAAGRRMPEKTTFFHPNPRTGMAYRRMGE